MCFLSKLDGQVWPHEPQTIHAIWNLAPASASQSAIMIMRQEIGCGFRISQGLSELELNEACYFVLQKQDDAWFFEEDPRAPTKDEGPGCEEVQQVCVRVPMQVSMWCMCPANQFCNFLRERQIKRPRNIVAKVWRDTPQKDWRIHPCFREACDPWAKSFA